MEKKILTNNDIEVLAQKLREHILNFVSGVKRWFILPVKVYGVPRGGIPVAYLISGYDNIFTLTDDPEEADIIVDDIICTGKTQDKYTKASWWYDKPRLFAALIPEPLEGVWYVFPWEQGLQDESATDIPTRFLQYIGEDPEREGLRDTPQRVVKSWSELYAGYNQDPKTILSRDFEIEEYDQMIILRKHEFFSTCEHHLLPFIGTASVAYIPSNNKKVVGISKLARLVNCFSQRLQIQERMTQQIANAITECINPLGVGVFIEAQHMCIKLRGVRSTEASMCTSALTGVFREPQVRSEFFNIINR